jgi:hypothetical protein
MLPNEDRPFDQARYDATLNRIAQILISDRCRFRIEHFGEGQCNEPGFDSEHDRIVLAIRNQNGAAIDSAQFLFDKMQRVLGNDMTIAHGIDHRGQPFVSIADPKGVGFTNDELFNFLLKVQRDAGLGMGC